MQPITQPITPITTSTKINKSAPISRNINEIDIYIEFLALTLEKRVDWDWNVLKSSVVNYLIKVSFFGDGHKYFELLKTLKTAYDLQNDFGVVVDFRICAEEFDRLDFWKIKHYQKFKIFYHAFKRVYVTDDVIKQITTDLINVVDHS